MKAFEARELLLLLVMLPACGQQLVGFPQTDGPSPDAGMADVLLDAPTPDAVIADVPTSDASRADAATTDAESTDGSGPGPLVANTMTLPPVGAVTCGRSVTRAWVGVVSVPGNGCPQEWQ